MSKFHLTFHSRYVVVPSHGRASTREADVKGVLKPAAAVQTLAGVPAQSQERGKYTCVHRGSLSIKDRMYAETRSNMVKNLK